MNVQGWLSHGEASAQNPPHSFVQLCGPSSLIPALGTAQPDHMPGTLHPAPMRTEPLCPTPARNRPPAPRCPFPAHVPTSQGCSPDVATVPVREQPSGEPWPSREREESWPPEMSASAGVSREGESSDLEAKRSYVQG
ncbi:hypothetical protein CapIbe_019942 [Capra ibex]